MKWIMQHLPTKRLMMTLFLSALVVTFASVSFAADSSIDHHHHIPPAIDQPAASTARIRTVYIELFDYTFDPASIQVKAGETVRFRLTNTGQLLHEFYLGSAAMQARHRQDMTAMAEHGTLTAGGIDAPLMKRHGMNHDDPNAVLVPPNETRELVWTFGTAMDLGFACNIPGHSESGMVGIIEFVR